MFSFAKAVAFATVAFIGAQAAPAVVETELISRNATTVASTDSTLVDGHLFVCVNAGFVQPCNNFNFNIGVCINFVSPFQDSISSLGPDAGFTCIVFADINCSGQALAVTNPGISNLSPTGLNDAITSFQCFRS